MDTRIRHCINTQSAEMSQGIHNECLLGAIINMAILTGGKPHTLAELNIGNHS